MELSMFLDTDKCMWGAGGILGGDGAMVGAAIAYAMTAHQQQTIGL